MPDAGCECGTHAQAFTDTWYFTRLLFVQYCFRGTRVLPVGGAPPFRVQSCFLYTFAHCQRLVGFKSQAVSSAARFYNNFNASILSDIQ
jgi:hypothetical protein